MSQIHLRVFRDGIRYQQETLPSLYVVDIYYNESLQLQPTHEDAVIACIHWDGPPETASTSFTIIKPDWRSELGIDEDIFSALLKDRTLLRAFLREMYTEVGIKLVCVRVHPLVFRFLHEDGNRFARNSNFHNILKTFISKCTSRNSNIECKTRTIQGQSECTEINHGFHAASSKWTPEDNEADMINDERLKEIKKEMQSHSNFIEEQFASQQDEMNELMKSITSLSETLSSGTPPQTPWEHKRHVSESKDETFQGQHAEATVVSLNEEFLTHRELDEYRMDLVSGDQDAMNKMLEEAEASVIGQEMEDGYEETADVKAQGKSQSVTRIGIRSIAKQIKPPSVTERFDDTVPLSQTKRRKERERDSEDTSERYGTSPVEEGSILKTSTPESPEPNDIEELGRITARREMRNDFETNSERIESPPSEEASSLCRSKDTTYDKQDTVTVTYTLSAQDESPGDEGNVETIPEASGDFDETFPNHLRGENVSQSFSERSPPGIQSYDHHPPTSIDQHTQLQDVTGGLDEATLDSLMEAVFGEENAESRFMRKLHKVVAKDKHTVMKAGQYADTMLCLDTSHNISPGTLEEMKTAVHTFISGVEEIAAESGIEENIGIVSFGGQAKILHFPTNDYEVLREIVDSLTCGGTAPLHHAAMLSLACLSDEQRNIPTSPFVAMKVIVMTAGRPSAPVDETTGQALYPDNQERLRVTLKIRDYGDTLAESGVVQYIWIPVGKADRTFLGSMAKFSKGKIMEAHDIQQLCHFQKNRIIASNVLKAMEGSESISDLDTFICIFGNEMNAKDKDEVKDLVVEFLKSKEMRESPSTDVFNNICNKGGRLFPLGSRVVRGPNWTWGNQDSNGPGTVVNHLANRDWVQVQWDNGHLNEYRCGCGMMYDLVMDDTCPRQYRDPQRAEIGVQVERGPDWSDQHGDEDGGSRSYGVIIRTNKQKVKVIWRNGNIKEYKFGENDEYEVKMRDATEYLLEMTSNFPSTASAEPSASETKPTSKQMVWQRRGNKGWEDYSPEEQKKLNTDFNNGQISSLLERHGKSFRLSFKRMTERCLFDQTATEIRGQEM